MRAKLTQEAQNFVAYDCSRRLEQQLLVAPWAPEEDDSTDADPEDEDTRRKMRIIATCRGGPGEPAMAAVLDDEGEVVEYLKLNFLNERYVIFVPSPSSLNSFPLTSKLPLPFSSQYPIIAILNAQFVKLASPNSFLATSKNIYFLLSLVLLVPLLVPFLFPFVSLLVSCSPSLSHICLGGRIRMDVTAPRICRILPS